MLKQVLVVDDKESLREGFADNLEEFFAQYGLEAEVLLADGEESACKIIEDSRDQLVFVFTDLRMPWSGAGNRVAQKAIEGNIPVAIISGTIDEVWDDVSNNCAGLLEKPFRSEEMTRLVGPVLEFPEDIDSFTPEKAREQYLREVKLMEGMLADEENFPLSTLRWADNGYGNILRPFTERFPARNYPGILEGQRDGFVEEIDSIAVELNVLEDDDELTVAELRGAIDRIEELCMPPSKTLSENVDPIGKLEELGFTLGDDGIIRGNEIENCTIALPDQHGVVLIKAPDGQEFTISGVKGIEVKSQTVSGPGSVGFEL